MYLLTFDGKSLEAESSAKTEGHACSGKTRYGTRPAYCFREENLWNSSDHPHSELGRKKAEESALPCNKMHGVEKIYQCPLKE